MGSVIQQNCKECRSGVALSLIFLNVQYFGGILGIEVFMQDSFKDILIKLRLFSKSQKNIMKYK